MTPKILFFNFIFLLTRLILMEKIVLLSPVSDLNTCKGKISIKIFPEPGES
jgi:hypothetical protein